MLLAYRPDFRAALLAGGPLRSLTGETIIDPAALEGALAEVVERGYAVEDEEAVLGEASVAVPVADRDGVAVAAIAVVLPASDQPVSQAVLTDLRESARNVSRELGAGVWPPAVVRVTG